MISKYCYTTFERLKKLNPLLMKKIFVLLLTLAVTIKISAQTKQSYNNHCLTVKMNIQESFINVTDTIRLSETDMREFYLNSNLTIYESNYDLTDAGFEGNHKKYKLPDDAGNILIIKYKGIIANNKEGIEHITHANMFESTNGIIFEKGIYLSGETYWVPYFKNADLKTFSIHVTIEKVWLLVSQGELISDNITNGVIDYYFQMKDPTNQVCLIGNKWTKYTKDIKGVDINVYLINPDENLAERYLDATSEYLNLYNSIIGSFPYSKFDVVENFWETGYGMPSFTLLGKKVMRFPWVLNTSYPHEFLHNYWGNSVYVDYNNGNWCEGITTYLADHLIKEKDGSGNIYRRAQLKKYTDYVNHENDYPVNKFMSKQNATDEAIGYSKLLMINHMLRIKYGTDLFLSSYAQFYKDYKFKIASFDDIQESFEKVTGDKLDTFFNQWIHSKGAPNIELNKVKLKKKKGQYQLEFNITQIQTERAFDLEIPAYIYLDESKTVEFRLLKLNEFTQTYNLSFSEKPVRIDIDPLFDVMRILNSQEVPPTLSQILGSDKWTVVLPKSSQDYYYYKNLAITWLNMYKEQGKEIVLVNDNKLDELPKDQSVWILGIENIYAKELDLRKIYDSAINDETLTKIESLNKNETMVYTIANPKNPHETIGYINSNIPSAIGQLNMKFMHYSNFSYFGFEGKALQNTLKGNFPVSSSPLSVIINHKETIDWSEFQFPEVDLIFE